VRQLVVQRGTDGYPAAAVTRPPLHVLFVARWYPSHDQPGRGTFVADLAQALIDSERAQVTVASFEATHVRGIVETRTERARGAEALLAPGLRGPAAANNPPSWGAAGTPVARLPVFLDGERRRASDVVGAHVAPLLAFARGVAARRPIDLIHAHTGLPDGIAAAQVAQDLDVPLLVTEHASTTADDLVDDEARTLYRRLLEPPHSLVAVSRALAHDVARSLGVPDSAVPVLPNAVPVDGFPSGAVEQRDASELLYVGSRKASKGIETLLRAFAQVLPERPGLRLRLIGSPGQPADQIRWDALTGDLGIRAAVSFEGAASRDEVAAAMRQAALFVHPSPRETFGVVAAEALASGLPVAATPSGGVDEIVGHDGRFGAVATSLAPSALADAITRALAASGRMDRAGMRAHVESRFGADAVAARTIETYDALLGAFRPNPRRIGGRAEALNPDPISRSPVVVGLPLVVAMARGQAIERVALVPAPLRDRLTVVTSPRGRYADDRELPVWGTWLEYDPEQFYRDAVEALERAPRPKGGLGRLAAALGGGDIEKRRKDLAGRRDDVRRDGTTRFFGEAIRSLGGGTEPVWIVALDADDVLLADRVRGAAGRLAPGGLRWLVDLWDQEGRIW
jgi:glycosyltransferase involved in cell wall biosynthesis